jgi:hypothetical protein
MRTAGMQLLQEDLPKRGKCKQDKHAPHVISCLAAQVLKVAHTCCHGHNT